MPARSIRRIIGFILGIAFLSWLPIEDTTIWMAMLLSTCTCLLVGDYWVEKIHNLRDDQYILKLTLLGVPLGLATKELRCS
jgi:hypothetical protein